MAISLIKEFKQKQKVSQTPQLKKSIDLLQLSRYELIQKIDNEIESNPFIEKEDFDDFEFKANPDENFNNGGWEAAANRVFFFDGNALFQHYCVLAGLNWYHYPACSETSGGNVYAMRWINCRMMKMHKFTSLRC